MAASGEDEADSRIGKAQLAAPFAVVHIAAAAAAAAVGAASSSSWQDRVVAGHIEPFAGTVKRSGPSLLLRYTVPTDDGSQMKTAPGSLVERLPSVASRRLGVRLHLADASILGETG